VKAPSRNPKEELSAYAASKGGEWVDEISSLQGGNASVVEDLNSLSRDAKKMIKMIAVTATELTSVPDLHFLPSLEKLILSSNQISNISALVGLRVSLLDLGNNHYLKDITALSLCLDLEDLTLVGTGVEGLPDFSRLSKLKGIGLAATPLRSLHNIDTIPGDFDLNIIDCTKLDNIEALRHARVRTLFIDKGGRVEGKGMAEGTYDRFESWFDDHETEIKARQQKFVIRFTMGE
jgi:hypothetical protein